MKKREIGLKVYVVMVMLVCISLLACGCFQKETGLSAAKELLAVADPDVSPIAEEESDAVEIAAGEEVYLPVLIYHHFNEEETAEGSTTTIGTFREHIAAIKQAGYQTVTLNELLAFVECRGTLPENPLLITMDDGYESNLTLAAPILEEYGYSAVLFAIGTNAGHPNQAFLDKPLSPSQFTLADAREWVEKGVVDIQSHTFNMHQYSDAEKICRNGVLIKEGESEEDYRIALRVDFSRAKAQLENNIGKEMIALAFPYGYYSDIAVEEAKNMGAKITFAADHGGNYVVSGDPESLHLLLRINGLDLISGKDIVRQIELAKDVLDLERETAAETEE